MIVLKNSLTGLASATRLIASGLGVGLEVVYIRSSAGLDFEGFVADRPVNFSDFRSVPCEIHQCFGQPSHRLCELVDGERLEEIGAVQNIGSIGDCLLRQCPSWSVNSHYKIELIRGPGQGQWKTVEEAELATLMWPSGTTSNGSTHIARDLVSDTWDHIAGSVSSHEHSVTSRIRIPRTHSLSEIRVP
jgi:hypothetical protein